MGKRVFWVVFLLMVAPLAAIGIMASPFGYLGALVYTKVRNSLAEASLDVALDAVVDGRTRAIRRTVRCTGGSTATDEGARLRFTAHPSWLVEDLGQGETLVLPVHGLCRAAVDADWSFPGWTVTLRPKPDFVPLAMIVAADGTVTAHVQSASLAVPGGRVALSPLSVAAAAGAMPAAQPPLPPGLVGTVFHYALLTPVPKDLLGYYPPLAEVAGRGPGLMPVELLPEQMAFATYRFPEDGADLAARPDAGRVATPRQQHALPQLTGLRRVGDRLVAEPVPGVLALSPSSLAGTTGSVGGVEVGIDAGSPWRRLLVDSAGVPALLDVKTARLPAE